MKENTHAIHHWLRVQASAAVEEAVSAHDLGHVYAPELRISQAEIEDMIDDFRAGKRDARYYGIARLKAIRLAARLLRFAAMAHRAEVREK